MNRQVFLTSIRSNTFTNCSLLIVIVVLLTSCAHKLDNAFIAPDFSYHSLKNGGLIYAGVIPVSSELDGDDQTRLSEIGYKVLKKIRGDLTIYDTKWLQERISPEKYKSLVNDIDRMPVDEDSLAFIREKTPDIQYIIFTKIIQNQYKEYDINEYEPDEQKYDLHHYRSRTMNFQVELYDLEKSQVVWSGRVGRTETEKDKEDVSFGDSIIDGIVGGIIGGAASLAIEGATGYPMSFDTLSQENLLIGSFIKISHSLPQPQKGKNA